jgi:hypothetical protein
MRSTSLLLLLACSACAQEIHLGIERVRDLGHGFRRVLVAEQNPPGVFESVGHFEYLYYRERKLSQANEAAIAPSARAIVYQDGPSGNIFLFRRTDGSITQLTKSFPGLVNRYVWREPDGVIDAFVVPSSTSKRPGKWIRLPIPKRPNHAMEQTADSCALNS